MKYSPLFHPDGDPVMLKDDLRYAVFSCVQWKNPNLEAMPVAGKQRLAILHNQSLDQRFVNETLERAYIHGAIPGVKVIAVHKDSLYLILSDEVSSCILPTLESLWEDVLLKDINAHMRVNFRCENEVYSGRSDYPLWSVVKEILKTNALGIEEYVLSPPEKNCPAFTDEHIQFRQLETRTGFCASANRIDLQGHNSHSDYARCVLASTSYEFARSRCESIHLLTSSQISHKMNHQSIKMAMYYLSSPQKKAGT